MKAKEAYGTVFKNESGRFHAKLEVGFPNEPACYKARGRKRRKDAIAECEAVAKKIGWKIKGSWQRG